MGEPFKTHQTQWMTTYAVPLFCQGRVQRGAEQSYLVDLQRNDSDGGHQCGPSTSYSPVDWQPCK